MTKLMNRMHFLPGIGKNGVIRAIRQKAKSLPTGEDDIVLMMDEIYLRKGFAFNPSSNDITGYVDHGEHGRKPNAANHALVYMIRSIYGDWKMPVAYYFTGGDT